MKEGFITMSIQEHEKLNIIYKVIDKRLRQKNAAKILGISIRQVKRLVRKYKQDGPAGLVSKRRGKTSNRCYTQAFKQVITHIIREKYYDFGPTLAQEKLVELDNIKISVETTRQLMINAGLWVPKKEKIKVIHPPRLRRGCQGELVQIDGSPHDWFEERGPRCTLIVFIDDATSQLKWLRFFPAETTFAYFNATKSYIERYGKPVSFYADKLGVFKVNAKEPKTGTGLTQFQRAMADLEIELIHAHSPQAKGRVERANKTLQDRLVKELRLRGISDIETANKFLEKEYIGNYNSKFAVPPRDTTDLHTPADDSTNIDLILTIQDTRSVSKNLTIQYKNRLFQIEMPGKGYRLRQAQVTVCESESGKITLLHNGQSLSYKVYNKDQVYCEPVTAKELDATLGRVKSYHGHRSPENHPWRQDGRIMSLMRIEGKQRSDFLRTFSTKQYSRFGRE